MNKALFLLLLTLTHSQSDGTLLPSSSELDKFVDSVEDFQVKEWQTSGFPQLTDLSKNKMVNSEPFNQKKRSENDILTRRSALDKNFMRFGRDPSGIYVQSERYFPKDSLKSNFFRFGRSLKDNFIRFGRAGKDNFIRFGRSGKDGFMRFGRVSPEDIYQSGKSIRENFMRFGRPDVYFPIEGNNDNQFFTDFTEGVFGRTERPLQDSLIRYGKNVGNQKERNGTKFLLLGRKMRKSQNEEEEEEAKREIDENTEGYDDTRKKRETPSCRQVAKTNNALLTKRSPAFFEEIPARFSGVLTDNFSPRSSWQTPEPLKKFKMTPFFPVLTPYSRYNVDPQETKKSLTGEGTGSGSNFIRFG